MTTLLALLAGAAAMALEILASRWLMPAHGATLATWAIVISVTLGFGSAGAWLGGSGRVPARRGVSACLAVAAAWTAAGAALAPAAVAWTLSLPALASIASAATLLLAPPLVALGAVLPQLVALAGSPPLGRSVGRLIAASTLGSLLGTLATALWLVPVLGLRNSAGAVALGLAAGSLACLGRRPRAAHLTLVALCALPLCLRHGRTDALVVRQTPYGELTLAATPAGLTLRVNGIAQATSSPLAAGRGSLLARGQWVEALPYLHPTATRALVIGLGGGLASQCLERYAIDVETVEVDPAIVEVARRWLGFSGKVRLMDGRAALRAPGPAVDLLVLDAFAGEAPPPHLLTLECFEAARARLRPGGILCLHLIGRPQHAATRAVVRTLHAAFPHLLCLRASPADDLQDLHLLASDRPLVLPPHPELAAHLSGGEVFEPQLADAALLTDDRSSFELDNEPNARALRRRSR